MKISAHGDPISILNGESKTLSKSNEFSELEIQELIFEHPDCLPISDIDESYNPLVPVCMELSTLAGPLDIFMITPNGDIAIIETKLWRNPESRRKVVAQILDYAKEISKWSYSDLQREINKKLKTKGNHIYQIAAKKYPNQILNEIDFVDSISRNLRLGKFLLLIAGDGIREGAKEIAEFLKKSAGLNFALAIIEMPIYKLADNSLILLPRTSLKTVEIEKISIEIPEGLRIVQDSIEPEQESRDEAINPELLAKREYHNNFWRLYVDQLELDDPSQATPKTSKSQNLYLYPGLDKSTWISAYLSKSSGRVGVYFRFSTKQSGRSIKESLSAYSDEIRNELGDEVTWNWDDGPANAFGIVLPILDFDKAKNRKIVFQFFNKWINHFVNIVRPRIKQIE